MSLPAQYATTYTKLVEKAKELGYALPIHGTLGRDLDVVAIPWTEDCVDIDILIIELTKACGGFASEWLFPKPHHRQTWVINLGEGAYVDLSLFLPKTSKYDLSDWKQEVALRDKLEEAGIFKTLDKATFRKHNKETK